MMRTKVECRNTAKSLGVFGFPLTTEIVCVDCMQIYAQQTYQTGSVSTVVHKNTTGYDKLIATTDHDGCYEYLSNCHSDQYDFIK